MTDIFFYVQHLLGIGHLRRAAILARALAAEGFGVRLVSGGMPLRDLDTGGAELIQLPPLRSRDETFSALVDAEGNGLDEAWKAARRDRLLALYRDSGARILLTEQFPFGRRQLRFELLPLLAAARKSPARPLIACSVRDIVNAPAKPGKTAWTLRTLERSFDLVMVHGDPALLPFEASFPPAAGLRGKIRHTGYVAAPPPESPRDGAGPGRGEVVVSTGGGAVAGPLIGAALAARPLTRLARVPWRILVGPNHPEAALRGWRARAPDGVVLERARPDFPALLARARLSISQAGYNTVTDLLRAGTPAVLVPFAGAGETEQSLRARCLAARNRAAVVEESGLSGATLAAGVRRALDRSDPDRSDPDRGGLAAAGRFSGGGAEIRLDGAEATARLLKTWPRTPAPDA